MRRAFMVAFAALFLLIVASIVAIAFMSELARVVTLLSGFTVTTIVFLVAILFINSNYICPACGEAPIFPRSEGVVQLGVAVCEKCGAALK